MQLDAYYYNARIVGPTSVFDGALGVRDGRVALLADDSVTADVDADARHDVGGRIVLPGVIDEHVHFSHPGRDFEGYLSGSHAAAAGGVTTAIDMPLNDLPPTTTAGRLREKLDMVEGEAVVDYANWGGLVEGNLDELAPMHDEGAVAFKAFMKTGVDFPMVDDGQLFAGLKESRRLGSLIGVHAENEGVLNQLTRELKAAGRSDRPAWLELHSKEVELEAIQRAIFWARAAEATLLVCHVSTADAVRAIARAKAEGVRVFTETCAHYLFFDSEDFFRVGSALKASPGIRDRAEVEALWECVHEGLIDTIASDHSPFPLERHLRGADTIWDGGGLAGIQSTLPAMISEGVHARGVAWPVLSRLLSTNPARIFGLHPKKGTLEIGADADFVVVDPDAEWTLETEQLFNRHKISPYVGRTFRGRVDETVVRGVTVYRDGAIVAPEGHGRRVTRASRPAAEQRQPV